MPYWPTHRDIAYHPTKDQFVVRQYAIPYGWFTYGPFDSYDEAWDWASRQDFFDCLIEQATPRSPWKSMVDPQK